MSPHPDPRLFRKLLLVLLLAIPAPRAFAHSAAPPGGIEREKGYTALLCALHVHSRFSNGQHEVPELAKLARQRGIDVLGISDSLVTRVRYGTGYWRRLFSWSRSRPGVLDRGVDHYLETVSRAEQQTAGVLLLAGVEVKPAYYWQGGFPELRLYDFDRHFLVFGLEAQAIRNLPVIENETWANTPRNWAAALWPLALIAAGILLMALPFLRTAHLAHYSIRNRRRFWIPGALLLAAGILWAGAEYPFGTLTDPYSGREDLAACQRLLDYVRRHKGLSFCSYPEARYPDIEYFGARMISRSHLAELWQLQDYNGFEGLYGDRITATHPGNAWDRLLVEYLQGSRHSWPSVITGIDFHDFKERGGWYELDRGQTVLWARGKTQADVLEALRSGRGYAVFQGLAGRNLQLRNFAVSARGQAALAGETLSAGASVTLAAELDWDRPAPSAESNRARLELIRDGTLVDYPELQLPIRFERTEMLAPGRHYYRLRLTLGPTQLLSNPIFVQVAP